MISKLIPSLLCATHSFNHPIYMKLILILSLLVIQIHAVISAEASKNSLCGGFSAVHVVIENLDVRTYDDPATRNGGSNIRARRIGGEP